MWILFIFSDYKNKSKEATLLIYSSESYFSKITVALILKMLLWNKEEEAIGKKYMKMK